MSSNAGGNIINMLIMSSEGTIFKGPVSEASFPSVTGQIMVLPGHMPVFTRLKEGEIIYKHNKEEVSIAVTGGFIEITQDSINVLADYAVRSSDIELEKAKKARERAQEVLKNRKGDVGSDYLEKELQKHILTLKMGEKFHRRRTKNRNV